MNVMKNAKLRMYVSIMNVSSEQTKNEFEYEKANAN